MSPPCLGITSLKFGARQTELICSLSLTPPCDAVSRREMKTATDRVMGLLFAPRQRPRLVISCVMKSLQKILQTGACDVTTVLAEIYQQLHFVPLLPPYFLQMPCHKPGKQARLSAGEVLDAALSLTQNVVQIVPEPFKSVCCGAVSLVASIRTTARQVSIQSPTLLDVNMTVLNSLGKGQQDRYYRIRSLHP